MTESRKTPRHLVRQGAWIFPGGGSPLIPCMMLDLSDAGARIRIDPSTKLPAQFILVMSRDGRLNRRCRAVWRDDDTIGVQFLTRDSIAPRQPKKKSGVRIQTSGDLWPEEAEPIATISDAPGLVPAHESEEPTTR